MRPENRDKTGRFTPGNSANPGGRPRGQREVQQLAESFSAEAIERLASVMRGKNVDAATRAAVAILDRAFGKPAQALDVTARRGPDIGAGGTPDAARAKLEALIAEAQGTATVLQPVALSERTEPLPALGESEVADVAKSWPSDPPEGTP